MRKILNVSNREHTWTKPNMSECSSILSFTMDGMDGCMAGWMDSNTLFSLQSEGVVWEERRTKMLEGWGLLGREPNRTALLLWELFKEFSLCVGLFVLCSSRKRLLCWATQNLMKKNPLRISRTVCVHSRNQIAYTNLKTRT